jgi:excisionase family DNA binding protein
MATSFLTNLNEAEFKCFLKTALLEIQAEQNATFLKLNPSKPYLADNEHLGQILDIRQAAEFLNLKVSTLYEKTSEKTIPHFKKGNKLYFKSNELLHWIQSGKVDTRQDLQTRAANYILKKQMQKR